MLFGGYTADLGLTRDHFVNKANRRIFEACHELAVRGVVPIPHTVQVALGDLIDQVGGLPYLQCVVDQTPTDVHLPSYAAMLKETLAQRKLQQVQARDYLAEASDAEHALVMMREDLDRIPNPGSTTVYDGHEAISLLIEMRSDPRRHIASGITYLDKMLRGGLTPGELTTLAGRPGQGKTTFALCWAREALEHGKSVGVLSFEMSAPELLVRLIAADTLIPADQVGNAYHGELERTPRPA